MEDTIFNLIFSNNGVLVWWTIAELSQLTSLKVILRHWQWDDFEKNHLQFRIIESCPCPFLQKE